MLVLAVIAFPLVCLGVMHVVDARRAASASTLTTPLTKSVTTNNKLVTVRFPPDFSASSLDDATLYVERDLTFREYDAVTVGALESASTNDPNELADWLVDEFSKGLRAKGAAYKVTTKHSATCVGKHPGVEVEGTFTRRFLPPYSSKWCVWIANGNGYVVRYDVPEARTKTETPIVERIENAIELH